jgi:hypothetical protein
MIITRRRGVGASGSGPGGGGGVDGEGPAATGTRTMNRVPRPGALSTVRLPPTASTMFRAIERPRPMPTP